MMIEEEEDHDNDIILSTMMMMMQVRLLLEKGASVEGNIDLDLDILTETPLQVIDCCYYVVVIVTEMIRRIFIVNHAL